MDARPPNDDTDLRPLMFSIAYRMTGSVTEAEDLAQEAFFRLERARRSGVEASFRPRNAAHLHDRKVQTIREGVHMTSTDATTSDLTQLAGTWALDPEKTTITFRTKAMWVLPVKGTAKALSGDAQIGPDATVKGTLVIDAASFDTGNKRRDDHLRSEDFLEVVKYPTIVFTADGGRPAGAGRVEITGALTVHGRTEPVTLQADVSGSGNSATVSTEIEIDRSVWGVSWAKMGAGLKNQVAISAQFERA